MPCPLDHVNRQFHAPAPDRPWPSDSPYVATWSGFIDVAFVINAYARRIVSWRVSRTAHANFALDPLEQALHERRRPRRRGGLIHHDVTVLAAKIPAAVSAALRDKSSGKRLTTAVSRPKAAAAGSKPDEDSIRAARRSGTGRVSLPRHGRRAGWPRPR
jgi:transposase InsO family protein